MRSACETARPFTQAADLTPDWSAKPQGVPYAQLGDPQSLNLYVYVRDNPIIGLDVDGHSWLLYDGSTHTVTLVSSKGVVVGSWTAYNNVAMHHHKHLTAGPMTNGPHAILPRDRRGAKMHLGGTANSAYGQNGIIHVENYTGILGDTVRRAGLHSGRAQVKDAAKQEGPQHYTYGCTRTTDSAMAEINSWAKTDPLTVLLVTNNNQNIGNWLKKVHRRRFSGVDEIVPRISATLQPPK